MRTLLDPVVSALARHMLSAFFRDVEIIGRERIPRGVPLLIAANHVNSVVIAEALETVTVSYASWDEARLIERAVALAENVHEAPLSSRFTLWKRFVRGYRTLKDEHPDRAARVASEVAAHDEALRVLELRDEEVASADPMPADALSGARAQRSLLVHLPLGLVGTLLNAVPYRVTAWTVCRLARSPGDPATYTLLAALIVFPVCWGLTAMAAGLLGGPWVGLAALFAAPLTGYPALRFREQHALWRRATDIRANEHRAALADGLREERRHLTAEIASLVDEYRAGQKAAGEAPTSR